MRCNLWLLAGFVLAACNGAQAPVAHVSAEVPDADLVSAGREIAEHNCARCHSIERTGTSPLAEAPPLRDAITAFDIEALATDFREHIKIGNQTMPEFDFSPLQTDALMAYLLSIETLQADE